MSRPIRVAIIGAAGYGAGELLRLFVQHPHVEVVAVTTTSRSGERIDNLHPHLKGFYDLKATDSIDMVRWLGGEHAILISAAPNGSSGSGIERVLRENAKVRAIDLSGDLRLTSTAMHRAHYAESADLPELRQVAVYGMPELNAERIRSAQVVANPGCLATAAILAGAPLMGPEFAGMVVVDAKTGSSGSGRALKETTHHPTRHADFRAYKPLTHQHEPEILQAWGDAEGRRIEMSFVPQSMATARGIFVTLHATLNDSTDIAAIRTRYERYYAGKPFIRTRDESPRLQDVVGSNFCDIGLAVRGRQVVVMAAIDNLVKGMAGAAIQNMNLMCGVPESTGLWFPSYCPV